LRNFHFEAPKEEASKCKTPLDFHHLGALEDDPKVDYVYRFIEP
jgi:hypothetical protein